MNVMEMTPGDNDVKPGRRCPKEGYDGVCSLEDEEPGPEGDQGNKQPQNGANYEEKQ